MTKPIRVLQVLSILNQGGAENMVMNLYRAIDREQIQFDFIVHTDERGVFDDEAESLGATIYHAPKYTGTNHFQYVKWWKNFLDSHPEYKILHSHIRSCASIYIPIAKKRGLKTIIHSHSTSNGTGFSSFGKRILQYPLRYQADYLFACSKEAGEWLFGEKVIKKDNFKIIFNGIDCDRFRFDEECRRQIRKEYGIENNFVIGHVGRHTPAKNPIFLLEIFAEVYKKNPTARLLQIGQGEMTEQLKEKCRDLGIEKTVIFAGIQNNVEKYYSAMDVFLFPSTWEGLGIVAVEAQTSGLHCLVSKPVPTLADIKAGLFHSMDLQKSAKEWAITTLSLKNTDRSAEMAKYTRSAGYDINVTAKYLSEFYYAMIDQNSK